MDCNEDLLQAANPSLGTAGVKLWDGNSPTSGFYSLTEDLQGPFSPISPLLTNTMCVCVCSCVCRWHVCGEPHRSVLLRTGTTVAAQLHLQVQSDHRGGEETAVAARVPQRIASGGDPAQVSTTQQHTPISASRTNIQRGS